jgi:hypothetical protein
MGDEVLKPLHVTLAIMVAYGSLFAQSSSLKDEVKMYDTLFEAINKKRFGLDPDVFKKVKDPFVKTSPTNAKNKSTIAAPKRITYTLYSVMENRAKINDRWVKKGEVINGLKLVKITSKSAVLANSQRTLTLTLSQKGNRNVVITSN